MSACFVMLVVRGGQTHKFTDGRGTGCFVQEQHPSPLLIAGVALTIRVRGPSQHDLRLPAMLSEVEEHARRRLWFRQWKVAGTREMTCASPSSGCRMALPTVVCILWSTLATASFMERQPANRLVVAVGDSGGIL